MTHSLLEEAGYGETEQPNSGHVDTGCPLASVGLRSTRPHKGHYQGKGLTFQEKT